MYKNQIFTSGTHRDTLESKIVASSLMGQQYFNKVQFLVPKDFKDHLHRNSWELIKSKHGNVREILKVNIDLAGMYAEEIWFLHSSLLGVQLVEVNIYEGYQVFLTQLANNCKDPMESQFIMTTAQEAAHQDPLKVHRTIIRYMTSISQASKNDLKAFHSRVDKRITEIKKAVDKWG